MAKDDCNFFDVHWHTWAQLIKNHKKPTIFIGFFYVFQLLLPRTSMHINEIPIICCHTLACSRRKILARSVQRGPSNQPRPWSTRVKNGENRQFLWNMRNINFIFSHDFWGAKFIKHQVLYIKKKPETLGYHHVEGYQDRSTWAREKGGVKISTDFESPGRSLC